MFLPRYWCFLIDMRLEAVCTRPTLCITPRLSTVFNFRQAHSSPPQHLRHYYRTSPRLIQAGEYLLKREVKPLVAARASSKRTPAIFSSSVDTNKVSSPKAKTLVEAPVGEVASALKSVGGTPSSGPLGAFETCI